MDWISDLNHCVRTLYYVVTATWGGGTRGTETSLIQHANTENDRHVYVFNGMLTIVTTYVKTQSGQGHGVRIARCPSYAISRLLLLLVAAVYPAAVHIAGYVMDQALAQNYNSHLFLLSGTPMDTAAFSRALVEISTLYMGIPLPLRDWRQVMHTMLVNLANVDFTSGDEIDDELQDVHAMFAHSKEVGQHHYSLQTSNALTDISATGVASNQRVSLRWHAVNGILHPDMQQRVASKNMVRESDSNLSYPLCSQFLRDQITTLTRRFRHWMTTWIPYTKQ